MKPSACLTLALAMTACQGEPLGHKWQVDQQGKPIPGTTTPLWTEDEVATVRQGLAHEILYNVDCGTSRTPVSGEVLLFDGQNYTAECNAVRVNSPPGLGAISFNDSTARWRSGKSWNDQVSSMRAKAGIGGMCIRLRQNVGGGDGPGWEPAFFELVPSGTLNLPSMFPWAGASWMAVKFKDVPGQTCGI